MITVALSDEMSRLRSELKTEGFRVVNKNMADNADALIVSGLDNNFLGMESVKTPKIIIDASGKSVLQIADEIRNSI